MSDQRITQLTKLAQADVAANDVLPIVDIGSSVTKKVEVKELFQAGANLADSASIDLAKLDQASVTKLDTTALANDAITAAKLADDSSIAYDSVPPTVDNFEGRGYVNSVSKNLQVWNGTSFDQVVAPTAGIENLAVTTDKLADNAVTTTKVDADGLASAALATNAVTSIKILDGAVTTDKLAALSVTTAKIAANAVTADELANNAVVTASITNASITESKLATGAVTEPKLGDSVVTNAKIADATVTYAKLNLADGSVPGAKLTDATVTSAKLAAGAVTTGSIANLNVTTSKLADGAVTDAKIADGTITAAKLAAGALTAGAIAIDSITTSKILDAAITADKMADDSTTVVSAGTPIGSGAFEGQQWFDTNTNIVYVWDSTAWIRQAAINTLTFTDSTPVAFAVAYPDNHSAVITTTLDTQGANTAFLGPASGTDAAPTFRAVVPDDLPNATASTGGIIQPGTGLSVSAGVLNHDNTVGAGTFTKVTIDTEGHVSAGTSLEAVDIPNIDAVKITSGELPTARLADNAVTIDKLSDYSTASLGETFPTPSFIGQIHLNPLDKSFFMWDGNVFVPIGISAGQIIFAGTFDASTPAGTGKIASLTPEGVAAGFTVNSAVPASAPSNNKHYFVVSESGTITTGNAPNVALTPPDLILSVYNTTSPGWVEIDVSSGAGSVAASQVSFAAAGDIASSNVQTAIEEVSTECRNATNITSGTLAVAHGGTNLASYTKGDLIAASAATTLVKLPVGTDGQVLKAASSTATGLEWGSAGGGTVTSVSSSTAALTVATATTTPALTVRSATTSVDGIVQLSNSTSTTSSTLAATPTAVKSAYDLADAALPKAGGTVTGDITLGVNIGIQFEGATDDGNEIRLVGADATADRTITLPNVTGTVVTTGDSGTVTSAMIADGTIVNADINASAAIDGTKISPNFGSQTVTTSGVFSAASGTAVAPSLAATGDLNTGIWFPSADAVAVSTAGTERIRFAPSGALGLLGANYGSNGQVLTSAGPASPPTWTTVAASGSGDVALASNNAFTGANTFTNLTGQIFRRASTQDGILLRGRAGGTTDLSVEIVPATLTASRTLTAPDTSGTIVTTGDSGTVTSAMIADGTIANADIGASAGIVSTKLSFTQSGTGAVARTVDSKLKDVVSVKDFGAVGNGVADDTAAIQAAINAAEAAGRGTVHLPTGLYRVTATLTVDSNNVYIRGSGMWNTIITRSTNYGDTLVFTGNSGTGARCLNCGLTDIGFDNSGLVTSGAHLRMTGVSNFEVHSVYASNGFYNFLFEGALAGTVTNTYLLGANVYGGSGTNRVFALFRNSTGAFNHPSCGDIFVDNFNWRGNTDNQLYSYGVRIESADGLWFNNGHVGNSLSANISIHSTTAEMLNLVFFDNVMSDEGVGHSCLIQGNSSSVFETIQFSNCSLKSGGSPAYCEYGIVVQSGATVKELMFSNCIIEEFARTGVDLQSTASGAITFTGCMVKGNGRTIASPGYNIASSSRDISIIGGYSGRTWQGLGTGNQTFGVTVANSATNISINGVDLTGNATGPLSVDGSVLAEINNCILGSSPTVASASTLTPPAGFRYFYVSGTTTINNIQVSQRDRVITMIFTGNITVSDAVGNIVLNGNFTANNNDTLTVLYNGTSWIELSRSPN